MSTGNSNPADCLNPIDPGVLADYWLAGLTTAEEEAVEQHLLACDRCGDRLREVIALAEGVRKLASEGSLDMVVSESFLKRTAGEGLRVRQYAPPPGGGVQCTVTAEDDILIGRLAADLSGAKRVDLCFCDERGVEQTRWPDIPVDLAADDVLFQYSITYAKASPDNKLIVRLVAIDEGQGERLLGEYTFNHTRSLPGPGAW